MSKKQNTDPKLVEIESQLMHKPLLRAEFKSALQADLLREFRRPAGLAGMIYGANWSMVLAAAGLIAFLAVAGLFLLNPQNFLTGNNSIAGGKSSTTSAFASAVTSDPAQECETEFAPASMAGFGLPYNQCSWELADDNTPKELKAGSTWRVSFAHSEGGLLHLDFYAAAPGQPNLTCRPFKPVALENGIARYQDGEQFIYLSQLRTWEQSGKSGTLTTCLDADAPFYHLSGSQPVRVNISYRGQQIEAADILVKNMKLSPIDTHPYLAEWGNVQLTQECKASMQVPPLGVANAFGKKPQTGKVNYDPHNPNGMYWQRLGAERGLEAEKFLIQPKIFNEIDGVMLVHEDYVRNNYAATDGGALGFMFVQCGKNSSGLSLEALAAQVQGEFESQAAGVGDLNSVEGKKATRWGREVYEITVLSGISDAVMRVYLAADADYVYLVRSEATNYGEFYGNVSFALTRMLDTLKLGE